MSGFAPYLLSILRIVAAFLFMQFGTAKWFGFPAAILPDGGVAPLMSQLGAAPMGFWPLLNMGTPAVFCFLWLYIWAAGPGPFSFDATLRGIGRTRT